MNYAIGVLGRVARMFVGPPGYPPPAQRGKAGALAAIILVAGSISCTTVPAIAREEIIGRYEKQYSYGHEDLVLNADGTYEETYEFEKPTSRALAQLYTGGTYHNSGSWSYGPVDGKAGVVVRSAFIFPISEPPIRRDWGLTAAKRAGIVVLDARDPDGVAVLEQVPKP